MIELALCLDKNCLCTDQVQAFLLSPTAMYHTLENPLRNVTRESEEVAIADGLKQ